MSSSVLIAYDGSGSTGGSREYHRLTSTLVSEHFDSGSKCQILFWNCSRRFISREELNSINANRRGNGGTCPKGIAEGVKEIHFHGHLVIISDGQVAHYDVDASDKALGPTWKFEKVTCHLINTGGAVNMSITCPFTRNSPHSVYLYSPANQYAPPSSDLAVSAEDVAMLNELQSISTVEVFENMFQSIERAVIARTMGTTGDPSLRDTLLAMKKRIVGNAAKKGPSNQAVMNLQDAVVNGRIDEALQAASTVIREYYGDDDDLSYSGKISRLVSMCEGALRGAFDLSGIHAAIAGDRARRAATAASAPAVAAPLTEEADATASSSLKEKFTCPISMDEENDVILLVVNGPEPVLAGFDKDITNQLFDCPLNLFRFPEVTAKLVGRIDHPIGLRSYREADAAGLPIDTSPLTRKPLLGAICLGSDEEHCKATTWTLAHCLLGGKLVGNQDLWFACIWLLVERGHIAYLQPILPQLRKHMMYRMVHHTAFMSLSGLPEFPTTRVALGIACWFAVANCAVVPALPPARDVLRLHLPHVSELQQLVALMGYALPPGIEIHIRRLQVLLHMLRWVKKDRFALPTLMRALTQRCVRIDVRNVCDAVRRREAHVVEWIPIDGPPSDEQVRRWCVSWACFTVAMNW